MADNSSMAAALLTLTGLDLTVETRVTLFVLTLLWYGLILTSNLSIIVAVIVDQNLHEPMYIFLCNLCINALYSSVGFYPKFLLDLLSSHVISYASCMLQGYVIHSSVCCDFSILALMAYDRYVAICRPLVYHSVMTKQRMAVFVFVSWLVPLLCMFMNTATLLGLRLCGAHVTKLYCVNWVIFSLACSTPVANVGVSYFNVSFFSLFFIFIIWSYTNLIRASLKSTENLGKFMNTCLPHLISLLTFTVSILLDLMYMRFGSQNISQHLGNFMAIEFLLIPPAVNPFVYGFKFTKIRNKYYNLIFIQRKDAKCRPTNVHIITNRVQSEM